MSPTTLAALLSFAAPVLAVESQPSPRQRELDARIEAKARALELLSDRALKHAERIRVLRANHTPEKEPAKRASERERVLAGARELHGELDAELSAFQTFHYEYQFARGVSVIGRHFQGERPEMQAALDWIDRGKKYMTGAAHARGTLGTELLMEEKGWAALIAERAARRRRRWQYAAAAALAAAGVLLGLRLARAGAPPAELHARPAEPLGLPAQAPGPVLPAPQAAAAAPARCRIVRELKSGPLGPAYEAVDLQTGSRAFLKTLHAELCADPAPLLACARASEALRHPGIAAVRSVFCEGGRVHALAEWIEGPSLAARVAREGPLEPAAARSLLSAACAAIEHARKARLPHGDLRCGKILLAGDGPKVCDFGLGLAARRAAARVPLRRALGSPAYLAPEQEAGDSLPQSDVFALGVILYRTLTGRLPFEGPNFAVQKREGRYRPAGLGPALDALIARCLAEDPARRFPSAGELGAALDAR